MNPAAPLKAYATARIRRRMIIRGLERPPRIRGHGCKASILTGKPKAYTSFHQLRPRGRYGKNTTKARQEGTTGDPHIARPGCSHRNPRCLSLHHFLDALGFDRTSAMNARSLPNVTKTSVQMRSRLCPQERQANRSTPDLSLADDPWLPQKDLGAFELALSSALPGPRLSGPCHLAPARQRRKIK